MTITLLCPFTNKPINLNNQIGSYVRHESKKRNLTTDELRYKIYVTSFPCAEKETFIKLYSEEKNSLIDFLEKYGMNYAITQFLIKFYGIKKRGMSEAASNADAKRKETCLERYGVDHTFKVPEFQKKREESYLKKYGVDNPFKLKNFMQGCERVYEERYGCSIRERRSLKSKEAWVNTSSERRQEWLQASILSEASREANKATIESKLEVNFKRALIEAGISFTSQHPIGNYFFDLHLFNTKILIEINGTIWHADPLFYKSDDILPISKRIAQDIWDRDLDKKTKAEKLGYTVIEIWERELHLLNDQQILELLFKKLENLYEHTRSKSSKN